MVTPWFWEERMAEQGTVLVTGGSGFIAGWCIIALLKAGWRVRASLRTPAREAEVRAQLAPHIEAGERLSFHKADLGADAGWAEAVAGCRHVLHVASPFPLALPKNPEELIRPARDGALRVLKAARDAGVARVVLTSSMAAIAYGHPPGRRAPFTEADWTNPNDPACSAYVQSKTIAEKAAWDWLAREGGPLELAVVNPAAVMGPILGADLSTSVQTVKMLLEGALPAIPKIGFAITDVRDVADLHLLAMTRPEAKGERFLAAGPFFWFDEIAAILREKLGAQARRVPKGRLPDFLVRFSALFDETSRTVATELNQARPVTSEKAIRVLGWRPRSNEEAILASAESLLAAGMVRA